MGILPSTVGLSIPIPDWPNTTLGAMVYLAAVAALLVVLGGGLQSLGGSVRGTAWTSMILLVFLVVAVIVDQATT